MKTILSKNFKLVFPLFVEEISICSFQISFKAKGCCINFPLLFKLVMFFHSKPQRFVLAADALHLFLASYFKCLG